MTDADIVEALRTAHERAERLSAPGADLRYADLRYADLTGADLRHADLTGADLRYADLTGADLTGADLTGADLRYADLTGADLTGADLRYADLTGADMRGANLTYLSRILSAVLPSGPATWWAAPSGWQMRIGCWAPPRDAYGADAITALRDLMASYNWPEAKGEERDRRRPSLEAWIAQCEAHAAYWPRLVPDLAQWWGGGQP